MSAATQTEPRRASVTARPVRRRSKLSRERVVPILMVAPSALAIGIFVYGFIAWTGWGSLSNWDSFVRDMSFSGLDTSRWMLGDFRYRSGLRNVVVFTVLFVGTTLLVGLAVAMALDRSPRGSPVWRTIFLFPLAISFVMTGVVWQWLLSPSAGLNIPLANLGLEDLPCGT